MKALPGIISPPTWLDTRSLSSLPSPAPSLQIKLLPIPTSAGSVSHSPGQLQPVFISLPARHGPAIPQKGWSATPVVIARIKAAWGALALLLEERQQGENKQFGKLWGRLAVLQALGRILLV